MSYQVSSVFLQKFSPKEIHELKRVFKEHDHDYAAAVAVSDLATVLQKLGENVTPNQTNVMLQQTKLARPDQISFQEFLELLYDFRNGAIALDPKLFEQFTSLTPTPVATPDFKPATAVEITPLVFTKKTPLSTSQHTSQPPAFVQKTQWPPTGAPSTPLAAPTPVMNKLQWPSSGNNAATWGHLPSSAPQTDVPTHTVQSSKPQWPPTASHSSNSPVETAKWPRTTGDKSPAKPQALFNATSPSVTKSKGPAVESASKSAAFASNTTWQSAGNDAAKPQWPPSTASSSNPLETPHSDAPKLAQWPPTATLASPPPPPLGRTSSESSASKAYEYVGTNVDAHTLSVLQRRASAAVQYNSTIHEVKGTAGGLHSYSEEETAAFTEHINNTLHADKDVAAMIPIGLNAGLFHAVCDGVVLCKLINAAVPETIDERALNFVPRTKELNVYQKTENQNLCINAAKSIGCSVVNIGPDDLIEGKPILVLGLVWQIIKIQLTSTINLKNHPELMRLLLENETLDAFMKLPPDQILLRWMNYHLKAAGHSKKVSNFSTDVQDATAYSVLLHHIAPQHCDVCNELIPEERAAHVIQNARRLKVETFIKPRDITSGNPKLNMSFVAQLFNTCPALDVIEEELKVLEEILYDDVGDTREERVFRMWINSLAIDEVYVNHLYADLSDGMKLLKVLDKIQKGIVAWNKVNMVAPNKFKQVENCNYCVVLGKQLKFSLVNVGGADIFEGAKKMILSIVWQSMRYQQLKILSELAAGRGEITDKDIIGWANTKVRQSGRVKGNIVAFRDPTLSDGRFLLDLVHAVEPRAVNWDMVSQDDADDAKASNAKYAISCAQKIGATVFLTYEDIVEVKPKMMMTFVASLMLVDHQRA
ncbi:hypothetical protein CCR75_003050 [Bremia lactucae]|uniref:Calponin-homology (CH) domain-containing protein n=1 Tax=Bremia lactucae TaxID=4779 RepID=A0A976IM80_BRELC|nr:hypothetical protein CCR75_003050 [Bremia lactucae]